MKKEEQLMRDPVCGMEVSEVSAATKSDYQGRTYYFCTEACRKRFESDPTAYAGRDVAMSPNKASGGEEDAVAAEPPSRTYVA